MAVSSCPLPHLSVPFPYKFICRCEVSIGPHPPPPHPGHITSPGWAALDCAPESSPHSISERFSSCLGYSELGLEPGPKTETQDET